MPQPVEPDVLPPELASGLDQAEGAGTWGAWLATLSTGEDYSAPPPPLPEGVIPKVTPDDFTKYLVTVGRKLEGYEAARGDIVQHEPATASFPFGTELLSASSSGLAQAMTDVPLLFFQEDFNVDSSDVWTHLGSIVSTQRHQEVMEQLTQQLDTIETHLTHEIAGRYASFFEASVYVQGVGSHVQQLLEVVEQKRRAIHSLAEESGEGAQSAASLTRQRASLLSTLKLCMAMQQVAHAKGALDNTIAAAPHAGLDYMGALEILAGLKESAAHVPVGVSAIGSLPEYMDRMRASIQSSMVSDMLERCKFDSAKYLDTLLSGDAAVGSASLENGNGVDSLVLALLPPITGLCRIGALSEAAHALYKELQIGMTTFIMSVVGRYLVERCGVNVDAEEGVFGMELSQPLGEIDGEQFAPLLEAIVAAVKAFFAHCERLNHAIGSILSSDAVSSSSEAARFSADCCQRPAHSAISCWATLMSAWTSSAAQGAFGLADLKNLLELTDAFATLAEAHAGKSISVLRGHIQEACRATLECMHAANMKKLATSLDQEVWAYVPVPSKIANCAKEITARGGIEDTSAEPLAMNGGGEAGELQTLIIAGKEYRTIRTMHVLLELLQQYLAFCDIAPAFTPDVGQRVLGLLRTFNSRTCQLILGAGAMQVSGLKSISAKHLAISCHSVRAAAALFPALEAALVQSVEAAARRKLLADEYARTLQDMAVHCDEICNKIVTIMCDRLTTTTRDLIAMLSSAQSGHIGGQLSVHNTLPSAFAASTAKQLRILADILMSTSSEKDIRKILGTVLVRFTAALSAAYGGLELETAGLDGQVAADLVFLVNGLQALPLEPEEVKSASRQLVEIRDRYEAMARQQSQVAELRLKAAEQAALGSVVKEPPTAEPSSQGQAAVEETQEALTPEGRASHSEEERAEDAPPSDGEAAPGEAAPDPVEPTRVEAEVPQEDEQGGEALPDVTSTP